MGLATDAKIHGAIIQIRDLVGDRISTADAVLHGHGKDEGWQPVKAPDAVVFANSTEEIAAILNICRATGTPIIPYGAGTSIEGQVQAVQGGICVDVGDMDEILEVNVEDLDCTVQPGVRRKKLNDHLVKLPLICTFH